MKNLLNKKFAGLLALALGAYSQAAVTYDSATNTFQGELDMSTYYSGVEIAVTVIGVTLAVGLFFNVLKRARS